jgi:hypothetical protein
MEQPIAGLLFFVHIKKTKNVDSNLTCSVFEVYVIKSGNSQE